MTGILRRTSYLVPLALLGIVAAIDLNTVGGAVANDVSLTKETLVLVSLMLFAIILTGHSRTTEQSVIDRLQRILFLCVITFTLSFIFTPVRILKLGPLFQDTTTISGNLQSYILSVINAVILAVFALLAITFLRGLIYLKRKKSTSRNFRLLVFLLFFFAFYRSIDDLISVGTVFNKIIEPLLLYGLIILFVINSLRVSWINYLNRRQKIAGFWSGLIIVPLSILITFKIHSSPPEGMIFSQILVEFSELVSLFFAIYVSTAFGALLLHLPTAAIFDRKIRQITSLRDLIRTVSSVFEFDKLLDTITRLTLEATESNFSWLLLKNDGSNEFHLASAKNLTVKERNNYPIGSDNIILNRIREHQEPFIVNEASKHSPLKELRRWKRNIGSILAVPAHFFGSVKRGPMRCQTRGI